MNGVSFTLSYTGRKSDEHIIDFYDVSQALIGFQRSLALTTHLVLNGKIITQSPALKGAAVYAMPAEPGSWRMTAVIMALGTSIYKVGTLSDNSPLGHLVYSLYDYVVAESLGVHVDYSKSLGVLYEEAHKNKKELPPPIPQHQADSLIEKCNRAIIEMHRPISMNETANQAVIYVGAGARQHPIGAPLNMETLEFISETVSMQTPEIFRGRVSSYNTNTFKGRIYIANVGRPVAFELSLDARGSQQIQMVVTSLFHSGLKQYGEKGCEIFVLAVRNTSKTGVLKSLTIKRVSDNPIQ